MPKDRRTAPISVQCGTFSGQRSAVSGRRSALEFQRSAFERPTSNVQCPTCDAEGIRPRGARCAVYPVAAKKVGRIGNPSWKCRRETNVIACG
ncbi:MAG: hypothetical protein FJ276_02040 [Planctomycetes bacterium]|nr:hypothetical protein [Planctomycetota bacterium]